MFYHALSVLLLTQCGITLDLAKQRDAHTFNSLHAKQINYLSDLTDTQHVDTILDNILIPRVVGTPNHDKVHNYIVNQLKQLGFSIQIDKFQDRAPIFGTLTFRNIIGTLNPEAERFLVLACHYDSKYFEDEEFVGATDSAVPCAMLLNLAKVMQKELSQSPKKNDVSLMLLFLDGEEAFLRWSKTDSIYGARHLAEMWHRSAATTRSGESINFLDRLDVIVLLDLLGNPDPTFFSYFKNTEQLYVQLSDAEDQLAAAGKLKKYSKSAQQKYFKRRSSPSYVEDDHIPFMIRGVPILHLIPKNFPNEWHTTDDNRDIIDMNTVENLNKILRVFVAKYLHLPINA